MKPTNDKIILRVDQRQKETIEIGGVTFSTANKYETNYRYKSPTVATVVEGNDQVRKGDVLLIHHNLCYSNSAHLLEGDLFSVPFTKILFAKVFISGDVFPICGNLICKEIEEETLLPVPGELKQVYKNRYLVVNPGSTKYKEGDIIFTRPSSGYTIVYNWGGLEKKIVKVDSDMICGFVR